MYDEGPGPVAMSLWKELCNDAQALISGLDKIADQIDHTFNNRVIPAVQNSIVWMGQTLHGAAERLEVEVESTVLRLDDNYQQFVIRQIDPASDRIGPSNFPRSLGSNLPRRRPA